MVRTRFPVLPGKKDSSPVVPAQVRFRRTCLPSYLLNGNGNGQYSCPTCGAPQKRPVVIRQGRKPVKIDYALLDKLCAIQCTGEEIASVLGIDYNTLWDRVRVDTGMNFGEYHAIKSSAGRMSLRRRQWSKAVNEGSVPMLIWLGKQYLGQQDKVSQEISGKDGGPVEIERRYHIIQQIIANSSQDLRDRVASQWRREVGAEPGPIQPE